MARFDKRFGRVSWFWYTAARIYARLFGWRVEGELPNDPKMIGIIAPHTSNWDVFLLYVLANSFRIKSNWLAKKELLRPPLGWLLRPLGAIPVDRSNPHNVVKEVARLFAVQEAMYLAIAPEGTRSKGSYWKTGFYHIAMNAQVNIIFMYIDYGRKVMGFGPVLKPTGDIHADFEIVSDFYKDITPKHPECRNDMRIRDARSKAEPTAESTSP